MMGILLEGWDYVEKAGDSVSRTEHHYNPLSMPDNPIRIP